MNESKKHKNRILNFAVIGSLIAILLRKQTKLIIKKYNLSLFYITKT